MIDQQGERTSSNVFLLPFWQSNTILKQAVSEVLVIPKVQLFSLIFDAPTMPMIYFEQALRSRGGRGVVCPPKVFCRCALFYEEPLKCAYFEKSNQKCTWKLICYTSKLK